MNSLDKRIAKVLDQSVRTALLAAGFHSKRLLFYRITADCEQMIAFKIHGNWSGARDVSIFCEVAIVLSAVARVVARGQPGKRVEALNVVAAPIRRYAGDLFPSRRDWSCCVGLRDPIRTSVRELLDLCNVVIPWMDRYVTLRTAVRLVPRDDYGTRIAAALVSRGRAAARDLYIRTLPQVPEGVERYMHSRWAAELDLEDHPLSLGSVKK